VTPELATRFEGCSSRSAPAALAARELARWFAASCGGLLLAAAVALIWRRLAGAVHTPLAWQGLAAIGVLLAAAAAAAHAAWRDPARAMHVRLRDRLVAGLIAASLLAMGSALSIPGTAPLGLVLFWGAVAGEELAAWAPTLRRVWPSLARRGKPGPEILPQDQPPGAIGGPGRKMIWSGPASADVVEQQVRSRSEDGTETLCGWLRVALAPGQRSASVHVAFCPPFARTPVVDVQQREGPAVRIKTAQLLPQGARFDVKLAQPSDSSDAVLLEFSAQSPPDRPPST
jgi:hypothetical protein